MPAESRIDPRLRVGYLVLSAGALFCTHRLDLVASVLALQAALWLVVGLGAGRLFRQVRKLWFFTLFIVVSYALTSEDPATDQWVRLHVLRWAVRVNVAGALAGLTMVLRIVGVILAAQVARAGDSRAVAAGLGKLGTPRLVAASIDAVLALLGGGGGGRGGGGGGGGGRGRGGGGGGGRGRHDENPTGEGFWAALRRISRGDVGPIVRRIDVHIGRVEDHLRDEGFDERERDVARDVTVIAGLSLTMLGIKALKVLPNIPFAPGYKTVVLTPLYVAARLRTRSRVGATVTGLTMGIVAFLAGDGRYGPFEILKHTTPGVVCDVLVPVMVRGGRKPGPIAWSLLGAFIGAARYATIFGVMLLVQPPAMAWALLIPGLALHTTFGILSGWVSWQLVRAMTTTPSTNEPRPADPTHPMNLSSTPAGNEAK
jgi:hypothetical protein